MRLFLYQLQPIEVEKDGLVSVLHHRLASVEGRADIKARLLADEDISLTTQQEVALYFIAQKGIEQYPAPCTSQIHRNQTSTRAA